MDVTITSPSVSADWVAVIASLSGLVAALSWPVVAIAFLSLFKPQIGRLIDRIKRASVGDAGVDFGEGVARAEALAEVTEASAPEPVADDYLGTKRVEGVGRAEGHSTTVGVSASRYDQFEVMLAASPAMAVVQEHLQVEAAMAELADVLEADRRMRPITFLRRLESWSILDPSALELLRELRLLRNAAAHGAPVTAEEARAFRASAQIATQVLRVAAALQTPKDTRKPTLPEG